MGIVALNIMRSKKSGANSGGRRYWRRSSFAMDRYVSKYSSRGCGPPATFNFVPDIAKAAKVLPSGHSRGNCGPPNIICAVFASGRSWHSTWKTRASSNSERQRRFCRAGGHGQQHALPALQNRLHGAVNRNPLIIGRCPEGSDWPVSADGWDWCHWLIFWQIGGEVIVRQAVGRVLSAAGCWRRKSNRRSLAVGGVGKFCGSRISVYSFRLLGIDSAAFCIRLWPRRRRLERCGKQCVLLFVRPCCW